MAHTIFSNPFKAKLRDILRTIAGKPLRGNGEFSKRVKRRHAAFWKAPDAQVVKNIIMQAHDPIEKWQDGENWQRKLSNKYNSREFAKKFNCRVAELYWKGRDITNLDFTKLPEHYVIRPTSGHSSGLVFVMAKGVNLMDKRAYTTQELKEVLTEALKQDSSFEFLIEEFVRTETGIYKIPNDYKFYVFNGNIASIQVINRLGPSKGFTTCYDENWNLMANVNLYYPKGDPQQPPACLSEMVEQVKVLSKAYGIFARIDFYATDKGAVFGEFTPTPFVGNYFAPNADKMFVDYWDKYCNGKI